MVQTLYNMVWRLGGPLGRIWLRSHPKHQGLAARFRPEIPGLPSPPLWIHACSVGEVNTARPILTALAERFPGSPLLLTVSTQAGWDLAEARCAGTARAWFPFDAPKSVRGFLAQAQPRALVLIETEVWPNVMRETARAGIPSIIVNARLSDKHFPRYQRHRRLFDAAFRVLCAVGAQNEDYATRFSALGVPEDRVFITGNTKFDAVATAIEPRLRTRLRAENGFPPKAPLLLFGSTRPGDEVLAAQCWASLRDSVPNLRLIVAPRHLGRIEEAMAPFDEPVLRRSEVRDGRQAADGGRVFFLDTVGELVSFYGIADVAVIGGSFFPGVNGHNPLEPAALGVPTVFGPHMSNFPDPARLLVEARGAVQVRDPGTLAPALARLLQDPAAGRQMATRGRRAVIDNQGAIRRNVDLIAQVLGAARQGSVQAP